MFDTDALERFLERTAERNLPIIAGLWPLTSLRNAEFLANEVPGVAVPDAVLQRMAEAEAQVARVDAADAEAADLAKALEGRERELAEAKEALKQAVERLERR